MLFEFMVLVFMWIVTYLLYKIDKELKNKE